MIHLFTTDLEPKKRTILATFNEPQLSEPAAMLPEAQLLLLPLLLPDHLHVAVLPHALPQFDWTAAHIFPYKKNTRHIYIFIYIN